MTEKNDSVNPPAEQAFVVTRTFNAPLDLVWKAYTEAERLTKWWGPKGFKMIRCELDLRPGGTFHYGMESPDGHRMWGKFVYREVVPQERLTFVVSFSDESKGITRHPMSNTWPLEVLTITDFAEQDGKTTVSISGWPINATEQETATYNASHEGMRQGFKGTMDQLEEYLAQTTA